MSAGDKPVPVTHGAAIERFTDGAVTRQQLFPNDWPRIWPELADPAPAAHHPNPAQPAEQGVV